MNTHSGNVNTDSGNLPKSVHVQPGITVHVRSVRVFTFVRNRCSPSSGICSIANSIDSRDKNTHGFYAKWIYQPLRLLINSHYSVLHWLSVFTEKMQFSVTWVCHQITKLKLTALLRACCYAFCLTRIPALSTSEWLQCYLDRHSKKETEAWFPV